MPSRRLVAMPSSVRYTREPSRLHSRSASSFGTLRRDSCACKKWRCSVNSSHRLIWLWFSGSLPPLRSVPSSEFHEIITYAPTAVARLTRWVDQSVDASRIHRALLNRRNQYMAARIPRYACASLAVIDLLNEVRDEVDAFESVRCNQEPEAVALTIAATRPLPPRRKEFLSKGVGSMREPRVES